ncbi:hypothetical protein KKH27_05850 [bacterium]|nr:hypothetical protein [bacterium]MBU1983793.1 hypothetical protein [bacterium]
MRLVCLVLTASLFPVIAFGHAYEWTTFTSTSDVVDMMVREGHVWTATRGGLSDYDPAVGSFETYTNTRGLAMNECVALGRDAHGYVWAGLADGRITRIHPETGQVKQVADLRGEVFEITDIVGVGDEVFVGGNNGVYRFAYYSVVDNYRVLEPIKVLGTFPGEARVACLAEYNGYLYAGTRYGIARARLDLSHFSPPDSWETITPGASDLPEGNLRTFGVDSLLWIVSPSYVVAFDGSNFVCQSSFAGVVAITGCASGSPAAATESAVYRLVGDPPDCQWVLRDTTNLGRVRALACGESTDDLFVGIGDNDFGGGGVSFLATDSLGQHFSSPISAPGIGGNQIAALGVDNRGRLWAAGAGFTSGVYMYDGTRWTNYSRSTGYTNPFFQDSPTAIAFDNFGQAWVSTYGGGVCWFTADTFVVFNTRDSAGFSREGPRVIGIAADTNYVVGRVARSSDGDIYITNRLAFDHFPLVRVPAEWIARGNNPDIWEYYTPNPNPIGHYEVEEVVVDPMGRIWMGASRDGLVTYVLDRGNPSFPSDDSWFSYQPKNRQDPVTCFEDITAPVRDWDVDRQGYLWIATINGAYYTQGGVPFDLNQLRFICTVDLPVGNQVNAIHVDAHDNKWFGTDQGVAVLDKSFSWVHVFRTAASIDNRSDLISNDVTAISSNPTTGEVWIGTADGLSCYTSPYVSSDVDSEIWPYPNPFRADGGQRMCIDPQRFGKRFDELRVMTISGRLVRKLTWSEMLDCPQRGGWDGRNEDGKLVAGGVYLLVATTDDGQSTLGKVAVLGK